MSLWVAARLLLATQIRAAHVRVGGNIPFISYYNHVYTSRSKGTHVLNDPNICRSVSRVLVHHLLAYLLEATYVVLSDNILFLSPVAVITVHRLCRQIIRQG